MTDDEGFITLPSSLIKAICTQPQASHDLQKMPSAGTFTENNKEHWLDNYKGGTKSVGEQVVAVGNGNKSISNFLPSPTNVKLRKH